jgi:hypothetical protein
MIMSIIEIVCADFYAIMSGPRAPQCRESAKENNVKIMHNWAQQESPEVHRDTGKKETFTTAHTQAMFMINTSSLAENSLTVNCSLGREATTIDTPSHMLAPSAASMVSTRC